MMAFTVGPWEVIIAFVVVGLVLVFVILRR